MILHCMKKSAWNQRKQKEFWGEEELEAEGFIHCSTIEYFWRVASNFKEITDEMVLICLDERRLTAEVRYEDGDHCGRSYPHVYGLINNDAVLQVLPFLRDEEGNYLENPEFTGKNKADESNSTP
ncbi:MAG: DUF952 domain-containing protein [Lachnospiraceae bacterium]|nr:DUF952 domain-containing protein [Lachnospiraceae bacterium]